jgi:ATP-dependent RNA helicase DeaD
MVVQQDILNIGSRDNFDWMSLKDYLKETLDLGRDDVFKVDVKEVLFL